jgi:hypothetical protein
MFMAGRMPLNRLIARYDFAAFSLAAADAISGAAIKPLAVVSKKVVQSIRQGFLLERV